MNSTFSLENSAASQPSLQDTEPGRVYDTTGTQPQYGSHINSPLPFAKRATNPQPPWPLRPGQSFNVAFLDDFESASDSGTELPAVESLASSAGNPAKLSGTSPRVATAPSTALSLTFSRQSKLHKWLEENNGTGAPCKVTSKLVNGVYKAQITYANGSVYLPPEIAEDALQALRKPVLEPASNTGRRPRRT